MKGLGTPDTAQAVCKERIDAVQFLEVVTSIQHIWGESRMGGVKRNLATLHFLALQLT